MKAIIKEIITHLLFVLVCLMVAYSASDPFSYHLSESVRNLAEKNGVTKAYFNGKTYAEDYEQRKVKTAEEVSCWRHVCTLENFLRNWRFSQKNKRKSWFYFHGKLSWVEIENYKNLEIIVGHHLWWSVIVYTPVMECNCV